MEGAALITEQIVSIKDIAHGVAQALVRISMRDDVARLSTPLLFPGGTNVGVEISRHREGFLVSDMGAARREAELLGGERQFARLASEVATRFGVRFDQGMIFDVGVPQDELTIAVAAIANAAKSAVEATAFQLAAPAPVDLKSLLWTRLETVFGSKQVKHNQKVRGAADEWTFDAVVTSSRGIALFEVIAPHPNAVSSAVTKFLDVRDLGNAAPARVAVLSDKAKTPHLAVLGRTARLIRQDEPDEAFMKAA